jgi:hypothetical protein
MRLSRKAVIHPPNVQHVDWNRLVAVARHHRVVPLVWSNLQRYQADLKPPSLVLQTLRNEYQTNALRVLRQVSHLVKIGDALAMEGVPVLPLKGVALAGLYYGDLTLRHAGDLDLLIAPEHLSTAKLVLGRLGFTRVADITHHAMADPEVEDLRFKYHLIYVSSDGAPVEVHFSLHPNPHLMPVDVTEVLYAGRVVQCGKVAFKAMSDDLQFFFLATHGARHEWRRLQWLYDLGAIINHCGPESLLEWLSTGRELGLINPIAQGLILVGRLFGIPVDDSVARAFKGSARIRYMVKRAEKAMFAPFDGAGAEGAPPVTFGLRLYRMCISSRPNYHLYELERVIHGIRRRFATDASNIVEPAP